LARRGGHQIFGSELYYLTFQEFGVAKGGRETIGISKGNRHAYKGISKGSRVFPPWDIYNLHCLLSIGSLRSQCLEVRPLERRAAKKDLPN